MPDDSVTGSTHRDVSTENTVEEHNENVADEGKKLITEDDADFKTIDAEKKQDVTLAATVDVSDMDAQSTEIIQLLARQFEDAFMEIVQKNRDYSWSFLRTGCKLAATDSDPFDTPIRSQTYGLLTRTGDKRERLIENVYGNGDASVSDDPATTAMEAGNYYFFLSFVLDNPELAGSVLND